MGIGADLSCMSNYTVLNNDLLEQMMKTSFPLAQNKIFLAVLRKTLGWQKEFDYISYSQFEDLTGINSKKVSIPLKALISRNIILKPNRKYGINFNFDEWDQGIKSGTNNLKTTKKGGKTKTTKKGGKKPLRKVVETTKKGGKKPLRKVDTKETTKETNTKETIKETGGGDFAGQKRSDQEKEAKKNPALDMAVGDQEITNLFTDPENIEQLGQSSETLDNGLNSTVQPCKKEIDADTACGNSKGLKLNTGATKPKGRKTKNEKLLSTVKDFKGVDIRLLKTFLDYRTSDLGKPMKTAKGVGGLINKLAAIPESERVAALDWSMENEWVTIYPPKKQSQQPAFANQYHNETEEESLANFLKLIEE